MHFDDVFSSTFAVDRVLECFCRVYSKILPTTVCTVQIYTNREILFCLLGVLFKNIRVMGSTLYGSLLRVPSMRDCHLVLVPIGSNLMASLNLIDCEELNLVINCLPPKTAVDTTQCCHRSAVDEVLAKVDAPAT